MSEPSKPLAYFNFDPVQVTLLAAPTSGQLALQLYFYEHADAGSGERYFSVSLDNGEAERLVGFLASLPDHDYTGIFRFAQGGLSLHFDRHRAGQNPYEDVVKGVLRKRWLGVNWKRSRFRATLNTLNALRMAVRKYSLIPTAPSC